MPTVLLRIAKSPVTRYLTVLHIPIALYYGPYFRSSFSKICDVVLEANAAAEGAAA